MELTSEIQMSSEGNVIIIIWCFSWSLRVQLCRCQCVVLNRTIHQNFMKWRIFLHLILVRQHRNEALYPLIYPALSLCKNMSTLNQQAKSKNYFYRFGFLLPITFCILWGFWYSSYVKVVCNESVNLFVFNQFNIC